MNYFSTISFYVDPVLGQAKKKNQPKNFQLPKISWSFVNCLLKIQQTIYKYTKERNHMFWVTFLLLNFLLFSGKHQTLFKGINYSLYFFSWFRRFFLRLWDYLFLMILPLGIGPIAPIFNCILKQMLTSNETEPKCLMETMLLKENK